MRFSAGRARDVCVTQRALVRAHMAVTQAQLRAQPADLRLGAIRLRDRFLRRAEQLLRLYTLPVDCTLGCVDTLQVLALEEYEVVLLAGRIKT